MQRSCAFRSHPGPRVPGRASLGVRPGPLAFLGLLSVLLGVASLVGRGQTQTPIASSRTTIVLSDLHMGTGRDAAGAWHPTEDFRWADELRGFLAAVDREGTSAVDLVLNGDVFDIAAATDRGCEVGPESRCGERELRAQLERVLAAHRAELDAIGAFANAGSNRVTFVPGDADAALLLPTLAQRVVRAIGARPNRVEVSSKGFWVSRDGRLHAEHGHQLRWSGYRLDGWPASFVKEKDGQRLRRSRGARLIADLYRSLEPKYPLVDNVAMLGAGLKLAVDAESAALSPALTPALLRHLLFSTINWQQFRMELDDGDVEPPAWVVSEVRAQGGAFLLSTVPEDDPIRPTLVAALKASDLDAPARALSDEEIVMLCDYRAAARRARRRFEPLVTQFAPRGPALTECPRTPDTRGGLYDYFWRSRDNGYLAYIAEATKRVPANTQPTVFVLGHTHLADRAQDRANMLSGGLLTIPMQGFSPKRKALTPIVINGGAWQRTITPVQLDRRLADRPFSSLVPEDLAACYSFVAIPPYTDGPSPLVQYWRRGEAGAWAVAQDCAG